MQRVLIVEDDPNIRAVLSRHLRKTGYDVAVAPDAEQALAQLVSADSYDLVVTDMHLPGRSGVEVVRAANCCAEHPPVLCLTGDADADLAKRALEAGAAGYLLKPFEFFELDAVINTALRQVKGRDVSAAAVAQRSTDRLRRVARARERVVLRRADQPIRRRARLGWKAVASVGAFVLLSWLAGGALSTRPTVVPQAVPAATPAPATMFVPFVIETK